MSTETTAPPAGIQEGDLRSVGIAMNGVTGRMGTNQHLVRSILAIRGQGGVAGRRRAHDLARARAGRPERAEAPRARRRARPRALHHQPRRGARRSVLRDLLRRRRHRRSRRRNGAGDRRRQARLLREALGPRPRQRAAPRPPGPGGRGQARRGAGQALSPRSAKAAGAARQRLLRAHPVGARRVRLLGLRGPGAARPAAVLELPLGGRRRDPGRHAAPLALRARRPVRAGADGLHAGRHPHPRARGRGRQALSRPPPRTPPTRPSSSTAGSWRSSTRRGACASIATSWWSSRSTAREGSAVAGLRGCRVQPRGATPRALWNPDIPNPIDFRAGWLELPDQTDYDNGFKIQWELFLRHVVAGRAVPVGPARGRQGGPAGRAGRTLLARAPHGSRCRSSSREHRGHRRAAAAARRRLARALRARRARPTSSAHASRCARACSTPPPTWWPIRWPPGESVARGARLGRRRSPTAATSGRWGLGVAEAMDTAQRGMGLGWAEARELIRRSAAEARALRRRDQPRARAPTSCRPGRPTLDADPRRLPRADAPSSRSRARGRSSWPAARWPPRRAGRTTTGRCSTPCSSRLGAGDPALARRDVRPRAGRLLGRRRPVEALRGSCSS